MSKQYSLAATITVDATPEDLALLDALLHDESKTIGKRASFTYDAGEPFIITIDAKDPVALKTAITSISNVMILARKSGEGHE